MNKFFRKKSRVSNSAFFVLKQVIGASLMSVVVLCSVLQISCRITEDGITLVSSQISCPQIENFSVLNSSNLELVCSKEIFLDELYVNEEDCEDFIATDIVYSDDKKTATICLVEEMQVGLPYLLNGIVKDNSGNSLSFKFRFTGYNDHPAKMIFTEIRTDYAKATSTLPARSELIECLVTQSGNTSGLEIISGNYGEDKKYCFPNIEVKKGEVIVVHYRSLSDEGCVDELGDDLTLATGPESSGARDLWIAGSQKLLTKNDVVVLKIAEKEDFIDCIMMSESSKSSWSKELQTKYASLAYEKNIWSDGESPSDAVCADGMSASYTLVRNDLTTPGGKTQWTKVDKKSTNIGVVVN